MKVLFILIGVLMLDQASASITNIEGTWKGTCDRNGSLYEIEKKITEVRKNSININGQSFNLGKPTVSDYSGVDDGFNWTERMIYDWSWNKELIEIKTSARWVGSYNEQNGAWSGRGHGKIKLNGEFLEFTRDFTQEFNGNERHTLEVCKLSRI